MGNQEFRTLNELFLKAIANYSKPDAFLYKTAGKYRGLPSQEALENAAGLALALDRRGINRGDRVALLSENRYEWALTDYAVLGLGAALVPIYPTLLENDIEYILRDSEARGVVCSDDTQIKKILNIRGRLPGLRFIFVMNHATPRQSGVEVWQEVIDASARAEAGSIDFFRSRALEVRPESVASILYTSGTMGQAKGVVLTHSNLVSNILASLGLFPFQPDEVAMSFLPLSHIFERMLDYHYFWAGVSIAYPENMEALPKNLLEVRPTVMAVVPRVLEKVHARVTEVVRQSSPVRQKLFQWALGVGKGYFPVILQHRQPSAALRAQHALADFLVGAKVRAQMGGRIKQLISGAAPLSRDLAEFFFAVGLPVYEGYGLTETSPVISVNCPHSVKLGTVGRVIPSVEVKLDKSPDDGVAAAAGEILVRGPSVTPGYYHLDEENRKSFKDGWFRTGDLGSLDSDGFLTITGRKKNLFKTSGGKYVSPEKLENLFQGHPYVAQVLILGDGRRFVSALIAPNFFRLESLARSRGIDFKDRLDLLQNGEILAFMQQQVDQLTAGLPPHEKIRQIALLPREFSIEAGELSATQKVKRGVAEEHFRALIDEIYLRQAPQARHA
ncbi:MAG TPA: long-chain fatty acid--CoA ligase [Terriglobia bacterium]|nr:long-chain fatty acid--CoA ligase [Terriglobia bacterium]